ncbi:MAG: M28 family peptidase [Planctomycetes bacterium]|nr:M28 family peptidase [Planctomycetota bacterium]
MDSTRVSPAARRCFPLLIPILACLACAPSQHLSSGPSPAEPTRGSGTATEIGGAASAGTENALAAAAPAPLAALPAREPASAARIDADVRWLADDARRGRRAGTQDAHDAGLWIAERFRSLGLEPAGDGGTFLQSFEVPLAARPDDGSSVRLAAPGSEAQDWKNVLPLFCSEGAAAQGPLAFRGYGIDSLDQQWSDFGAERLDGAVVVLLRGTPPASELLPPSSAPADSGAPAGGPPKVQHAAAFDGSIFLKVMNAKHRGAAAVILLQEEGVLEPMAFDASQAARAGIPALSAPRSLFEAWVGEARARDWCAAAARRGHAPFGAPDAAQAVRVSADVRRERGAAYNVLARIPGAQRGRTVILGAHYDHLGLGGEGSLAAEMQGQVHNGADDNASGTAAVLEMARIAAQGPAPAGDLVFALWSGEELGLLGSEFWCSHPTFPLSELRANLNLDMVGRARAPETLGTPGAQPTLTVLGAGTAEAFAGWLEPDGARAGLALRVNRSGQGVGGSDHMSFMKRQIPVLHFFTGLHSDYHKPGDDSEKVDCESIARIAALGLDLVTRMQLERDLPWNPDQSEEKKASEERKPAPGGGGFKVWFGSIPDYAYEGQGVLLTGTSSGSPAQKAGMLAGDVLVGVGDVTVDTIHDFVYALGIYKPGDVVEARFLRAGEEQRVRITLATRGAE